MFRKIILKIFCTKQIDNITVDKIPEIAKPIPLESSVITILEIVSFIKLNSG